MGKLAFLLALCQLAPINGLPTPEKLRVAEAIEERMVAFSTNVDVTTSYASTPDQIQSATATVSPSLTGSINTGLPSQAFTRDPVYTVDSEPTGTLEPLNSSLSPGPTDPGAAAAGNIFQPMATDAPPQQITSRNDHIVKKLNIVDGDVPIETNKFYGNWFLGNQNQPVWTHPYSLQWAKGTGNTYGMAVQHVERNQFAWGEGDVPRYFIAPVGLQHIVFSAAELGSDTVLSTEKLTAFSVHANLAPNGNSDPIITIPTVQGMGFVTALYNSAKPILNSGVFFRTLEFVEQLNGATYKYRITLEDNSQWLLYATPVASYGAPPFELSNTATISGPSGFTGMIQVAKNPANSTGEAAYDGSAGAYATGASVTGSVDGNSGSYSIEWTKDGVADTTLLMFALPHHVEAFDGTTSGALTDISLMTTTKGTARAVVADKITMQEGNLPTNIGFGPWIANGDNGGSGSENTNISPNIRQQINDIGASELAEDFDTQTRLNSMYFSGKGLAKFASAIWTVHEMGQNSGLAAAGLNKLKTAIAVFIDNKQPLPLVYDTVWKGVVSSGTYNNGDTGQDFGNTLYNDHHFHYGYFVWTAAVIGYLDPAWMDQGSNRAWINMLVRDFSNPSSEDPYFPFMRAFDWYNGHSWAKGLFESGDGKDQESSSEDTFSTYAIKMWGAISGDANMEARGNLQLAVQTRSFSNYFLLASDNKVQPERFLPNKVTGILFENKVDHTTYFGANIEYIQGIHMIPLSPISAYTRPRTFVKEEWDQYFSNGRADVQGGWRSILYGNLGLIDAQSAYNWFADPNFNSAYLDGGASRTWYLAYTAGLMGAAT